MTLHQLRSQFEQSYFRISVDLFKMEKIAAYHLPPGDVPADLKEHLAAIKPMITEMERLTSPTKTRPLPRVRL